MLMMFTGSIYYLSTLLPDDTSGDHHHARVVSWGSPLETDPIKPLPQLCVGYFTMYTHPTLEVPGELPREGVGTDGKKIQCAFKPFRKVKQVCVFLCCP